MQQFEMRGWTSRLILAVGLVLLSLNTGCKKGSADASAGGKKQIAVIAKSTTNAYWKAVEAGARQAAAESNVDILWTGPESETNHDRQASMVDDMVNRKVDGIVLAPTNVKVLVRPVNNAVDQGIPVVLIDSTLESDKPVSVIATDNYAAGEQAADALIAAMGKTHKHGGKVIMLRFLEGSGSTEAREKGFTDRIKKEKGLELVAADFTKGTGSTTDAGDTAHALIGRFTRDFKLDVDGVFASNQPTAIAMMQELDHARDAGTIIDAAYVGFDAHEILLKGVRDGKINALVVQDPKQMGYLGVKTMVKVLNGEKVDRKIATSTATVTKANIDDPKIKTITLEN